MVGDILQPTHLLFILVVALLVLGPKRLPEVGRTLGSGLRDFRAAINGESTHDDEHSYVKSGEADSHTADDDDHVAFGHDADEDEVWHPDPESTVTSHDDTATDADTVVADDEPLVAPPVDDTESAATVATAEPAPKRTATASSAAFASALAASRQQTGAGEPDDE
jgi:sec-independent protein translocase protein TatA